MKLRWWWSQYFSRINNLIDQGRNWTSKLLYKMQLSNPLCQTSWTSGLGNCIVSSSSNPPVLLEFVIFKKPRARHHRTFFSLLRKLTQTSHFLRITQFPEDQFYDRWFLIWIWAWWVLSRFKFVIKRLLFSFI